MDSISLNLTKVHILRVDPGEDVLLSAQEFLKKAGIRQAVVLGGYGTLAATHLHWVAHNRLPSENTYAHTQGGIEILAMNGIVVDGQPHIHVALSTTVGGFGGHLEEGCIAYVICEIFFGEVAGATLARETVQLSIPGWGEGPTTRLVAK